MSVLCIFLCRVWLIGEACSFLKENEGAVDPEETRGGGGEMRGVERRQTMVFGMYYMKKE